MLPIGSIFACAPSNWKIAMKLPALFALGLWFAVTAFAAPPADYESIKAEAETYYADGSFAKARDLYLAATPTNLPPAARRWVEFRLADTQWRSQAATETADATALDEARHELEMLARREARANRTTTRPGPRRRNPWATFSGRGATRMTRARHGRATSKPWIGGPARATSNWPAQRYLSIVWRMTRPTGSGRSDWGYWASYVPLDILENALKIAQSDGDRARAHFLIAMTLRNQGGGPGQLARVPQEFEAAIQTGSKTDWYDDALYNYAEWMESQGRVTRLKNGGWRSEPDYPKALELFRRLVAEFQKGETRYWEPAQQQIRGIIDPQLSVSAANVFLPGSEIQYFLNWRNVDHIALALYPVKLNKDVNLSGEHQNAAEWLSLIDLQGRENIKSWTFDTRTASARRHDGARLPAGEDARQRVPTGGGGRLSAGERNAPARRRIEARGPTFWRRAPTGRARGS